MRLSALITCMLFNILFQGSIFYDTGELRYEGNCVKLSSGDVCPCGIGVEYYREGVVMRKGLFPAAWTCMRSTVLSIWHDSF